MDYSTHNDKELSSEDDAQSDLGVHTDPHTLTTFRNRLEEVLTLLEGAEKSGNPYLQIGFARAALDRLIATVEDQEEEDIYDDAP